MQKHPSSRVPGPRRLVAVAVSWVARVPRQPRLVVSSVRELLGLVHAARIAVMHRDLELPRPLYGPAGEGRLGLVAPVGEGGPDSRLGEGL